MSRPSKYKQEDHINFFQKVELPFEKSKDELWDQLLEQIDDTTQKPSSTRIITLPVFRIAAAAIAILFVSSMVFMRTYTTTIDCPKGQHLTYTLPDESTVFLNAESKLSYHPYWWQFQRKVEFEGEAFFDVEKGQRFTVHSSNGLTEILGTSFNIYARKADYKVFCKTGKVKVSSTATSVELTIHPGELAVIDNKLKQGKIETVSNDRIIAWKENRLTFTSETLLNVFDELERQFNVVIEADRINASNLKYTGNFTKTNSVEQTLDIICRSFNLNFTKEKKNHYKVYQN